MGFCRGINIFFLYIFEFYVHGDSNVYKILFDAIAKLLFRSNITNKKRKFIRAGGRDDAPRAVK